MPSLTLSFFRPWEAPARTAPSPPRSSRAPVFIGDAVQPWAGSTLLLAILQSQAAQAEDGRSVKG